MSDKLPVLFSWSGGKDSMLALDELLADGGYEVVALLTTVSKEFRRVSHHGVREELLEQQAAALGLPLRKIDIPSSSGLPCTSDHFAELIGGTLREYRAAGVRLVAHGDIFLEELRQYRERNLAQVDMQALFPIWRRDTTQLVNRFIARGYRAWLACVDAAKLGRAFVGRALDAELLRDLPANVDPCGEYGEYHSFVYDGPRFVRPVNVRQGVVVERENHIYVDLLADESAPETSCVKGVFPC
jgi:uncharacterized protein (TIGR00290 family)